MAHDFVRVNALVRLAAEVAGDGGLHGRHARHSSHQNHVFDFAHVELWRRSKALPADVDGALDQILRQLLERGAVERALQMQGFIAPSRDDEGEIELGFRARRKSSHLAFSAASRKRCSAMRSWRRSRP